MEKSDIQYRENAREHVFGSLVSWRSIFAGLLVAIIAHLTMTALIAGIGGASASTALQSGENAGRVIASAGIWMMVSTLIALALGGYFAARTSPFVTSRVGAAQGLIISSLFFITMIYSLGSSLEMAGRGIGGMFSTMARGAGNISENSMVQGTIQKALQDLNLKSDPTVVAQNLGVFFLQGNREGARNYLAFQSGQSRAEIDARMETFQQELDANLKAAGTQAADAVSSAGWALFATMFFGIAAALSGAAMGSRANLHKPLTDEQAFGTLASRTT